MRDISYFQTIPVEQRQVVIVDDNDNRLGLMEILRAHKGDGVMHRAISVLLYDGKGRVLLQKRSKFKPLWPLVWANTVCTHPLDGEGYVDCAARRLKEEMGISLENSARDLRIVYRMRYQAVFNQELSEFELDSVIIGQYQGEVEPDPKEVADYKWIGWEELKRDIEENPEQYTPWFKIICESGRLDEVISEK